MDPLYVPRFILNKLRQFRILCQFSNFAGYDVIVGFPWGIVILFFDFPMYNYILNNNLKYDLNQINITKVIK